MRPSTFTLILATANRGKTEELRSLLSGLAVDVRSLLEYPEIGAIEEDADTLEGNALKKARAVATATGLPALADDTGLEVVALAGAPGVRSARFAGDHASEVDNRKRLLADLDNVEDRRARFRTVIAFVGDVEALFEGVCEGEIIREERGSGGFGYDPVFAPEGTNQTFAEMSANEKNCISHRGRAMRNFAAYLQDRLQS
jgi:XTP/dITP diphosphohydrolase